MANADVVLAKLLTMSALFLPLAARAQTFTTIYNFAGSPDGANPTQLVYNSGQLYGITTAGGAAGCHKNLGCGTVFKVDADTGTEAVLFSFSTNKHTRNASGPGGGGLLFHRNVLYGTSGAGGTHGRGTIFSLDLASGKERVLYSFAGGDDGQQPIGPLLYLHGTLYGTTYEGGGGTFCSFGCGTVFSFTLSTGVETVLHAFPGGTTDGIQPAGPLTYIGGALYGATTSDNSTGNGTVFKVDATTGAETVLYNFPGGAHGEFPDSGLVYVDGKFYGTTAQGGGPSSSGIVFALNPISGVQNVLYAFQGGSDGEIPASGLVYQGGVFYGTTEFGGAFGAGTLFQLDRQTGVETVLHNFAGSANHPAIPTLTYHDGILYGSTELGGTSADGTIFAFMP